MAFPAVEAKRPTSTGGTTGGAATNGSTAAASHSVVLPATVSAGSLLMIVGRVAVADAAVSFPAGWTVVQDDSDASNDVTFVAWMDTLADGTEDGASVTVTHGTGKMVAASYSITDTANPTSQTPELSTVAVGADGAPDPTSLSPTGGSKDYLWFWFGGWDGEAGLLKTPATNYTSGDLDLSTGISGAAATNCQIKVGYRQATAASEDPGAISAAQNLGWTAYTIAVHPGGPSTVPGSAEIAVVADVVSVARRELIRAADVAAAAAVVASGGRLGAAVTGQATLDATASVAAVSQRTVQRQAAVDATADVAVVGRLIVSRQVEIAATAAVAAVPQRMVQRQASVDAAADVAGSPQRIVQRQVSIDAATAVDATGAQIVSRAASIDASAAVASTPQRELSRSADIAGVGDVQASGAASSAVATVRFTWLVLEVPGSAGITIIQRQASLDAAATVEAAGARVSQTVTGQAAVDATADVAATGARSANIVAGQAAISSTADVSAAGRTAIHARQASIISTADVTAAGIKAGLVTAQVSIAATGSVSTTPQRVVFRQAALDATTLVDASAVHWSTLSKIGELQANATVTAVGVALQVLRPSADSVDGDWTTDTGGTNLVAAINEGDPNDSTYIHSGASSPSTCRVKLSVGQVPLAGARILRLRAGNEAPGADLTVRLREGGGDVIGGGVLVNEFVHTDVGAVGLIEDEITGAVSNYADLYVELEAA